jgi:hypothetical protein
MTLNRPQALPNANRHFVFGLGTLLWKETGDATWKDVGNVKEASVEVTTEEAKVENTRGQVRRNAKTVVTKMEAKGSAVLNYMNDRNVGLFLMGNMAASQTQNLGFWEDGFSVSVTVGDLGDAIDIPGYSNVRAIVVKKGETTLTLTDTYTVDATNGTITIKADNAQGVVKTDTLTVTGENHIEDFEIQGLDDEWHDLGIRNIQSITITKAGTALTPDVDFYIDAEQGQVLFISGTVNNLALEDEVDIEAAWGSWNWTKMYAATTRQRRVHIWFKGDPVSGNIQNIKGYAMLKPSGNLGLINTEAQEFTLEFEFEDHADYLPGLYLYENHGSSD